MKNRVPNIFSLTIFSKKAIFLEKKAENSSGGGRKQDYFLQEGASSTKNNYNFFIANQV